jgi:hypothetical protein
MAPGVAPRNIKLLSRRGNLIIWDQEGADLAKLREDANAAIAGGKSRPIPDSLLRRVAAPEQRASGAGLRAVVSSLLLGPTSADTGNEGVGLTFQNFQWHDARIKHHGVEFLEREFLAERCFRFLSQLKDFQFADHVGTCLTGVDHVTFDFRGFDAVIDRLLPCPTFGVKSGIDNQSPGAKLLPIELSQQTFEVIFVPSGFSGEVLGVETPPLGTRGTAPQDAKPSKSR